MKKNITQYQGRITCKWKSKTFSFIWLPGDEWSACHPQQLTSCTSNTFTYYHRHWWNDFLQWLSHLSLAIANRSSSLSSSKRPAFFTALISWSWVVPESLSSPLDLSDAKLVCESVIFHWSLKDKIYVKILWPFILGNLRSKIKFTFV